MIDTDDDIDVLRSEIKRLRKTLTDLTSSLDVLLKRRGLMVYKKEPSEDLLIPEDRFIDKYYEMLKKYSFRLFLREVIKHQQGIIPERLTRYATADVTADYVAYLKEIGLIDKRGEEYFLIKQPIRSFGETLEWFLSEVMKRGFSVEAIWGVKCKGSKIGGDYDLIAKVDGMILYMEVKSSPPKQIYQSEISAFFDRISDILADISIFFMDTQLRMKDKIVLMFEEELKKRETNPSHVCRIEKELFHVWNRVFIINSKGGIENNIEKVLRWYFEQHLAFEPSIEKV